MLLCNLSQVEHQIHLYMGSLTGTELIHIDL